MKHLLILSLVLLSVGVFANDRVLLGTFGQTSVESADNSVIDTEFSSIGFGAQLYNFRKNSMYLGASFIHYTGDADGCVSSICISGDISETIFGGEIGWNINDWTPFIGASFHTAEIELFGETTSDDASSLTAGLWLDFVKDVKLRGAINNLDDSESRSVSGGFLYQMQNNFVVGAEIELLLDDEADGLGFSVHFGRTF